MVAAQSSNSWPSPEQSPEAEGEEENNTLVLSGLSVSLHPLSVKCQLLCAGVDLTGTDFPERGSIHAACRNKPPTLASEYRQE